MNASVVKISLNHMEQQKDAEVLHNKLSCWILIFSQKNNYTKSYLACLTNKISI